jgi:hypothetical protein
VGRTKFLNLTDGRPKKYRATPSADFFAHKGATPKVSISWSRLESSIFARKIADEKPHLQKPSALKPIRAKACAAVKLWLRGFLAGLRRRRGGLRTGWKASMNTLK